MTVLCFVSPLMLGVPISDFCARHYVYLQSLVTLLCVPTNSDHRQT